MRVSGPKMAWIATALKDAAVRCLAGCLVPAAPALLTPGTFRIMSLAKTRGRARAHIGSDNA